MFYQQPVRLHAFSKHGVDLAKGPKMTLGFSTNHNVCKLCLIIAGCSTLVFGVFGAVGGWFRAVFVD